MQRRTEHFHSGGKERPMRDLLFQLPPSAERPGEAIQYEEVDALLLLQIAENATNRWLKTICWRCWCWGSRNQSTLHAIKLCC